MSDTPQTPQASAYERRALKEIHDWKALEPHWTARVADAGNRPFEAIGNRLIRAPFLGRLVERSVHALIDVLSRSASWSVRGGAVVSDYRKAGHAVHVREDIARLDLSAIDERLKRTPLKYQTLAFGEGAGAGLGGLFGIPADIAALAGLNLRAIAEVAAICGFDPSEQTERLFALHILSLASSSDVSVRRLALSKLVRIAKDGATRKIVLELEQQVFMGSMRRVAEGIGARLTRAKASQFLPAVGAVVAGGFNAWYTARVLRAAMHLYRERFLADKYGPELIEETVAAAESLVD